MSAAEDNKERMYAIFHSLSKMLIKQAVLPGTQTNKAKLQINVE